ncbi:MAG: carboxypeptidase-like regulatory domain-containing protein [Prolixibacteraceae bacterium]|nr:carboxypeptidase-like regulatory domain-containing protein [Prolixibacteraceae bacterium]
MKAKILSIILISLVVFTAQADEKEKSKTLNENSPAILMVLGTVSDAKTGESLVGVEVQLEGTDKKVYTDFDGNFEFEKVEQGEHKIVVSYISYEKKKETLDVSFEKNKFNIALSSVN